MTPAYDHDAFMRLHVLAGGRVTVTRDGYQPRHGQLIAWAPPKRYEARVQFDGAERPLTLRLKRYGVEAER